VRLSPGMTDFRGTMTPCINLNIFQDAPAQPEPAEQMPQDFDDDIPF